MEEEYLDVLQNIEMAIVSIYRQHPELTDYNVDSALESLGRTYQREKAGGAAVLPKNNLAMQVYTAVKTMCDWRMGRTNMVDEEGQPMNVGDKPLSIDVIQACLKRVRKSVAHWNKESGTRGYLGYVSKFVG
jgi:hypothetical protein